MFDPPSPASHLITFSMEVKIAIFHKGLLSTYIVRKADQTTAYAFLIQNEGKARPAEFIRLLKQDNKWISAYPDQELIRELTAAIESAVLQ
jgi:hypothetical protein